MEVAINELIKLRDLFNDNVIFSVGILLIVGYIFGKIAEKVYLPTITGYIIAGLILSDSVTGIIHIKMAGSLRTITEVALGLIALTIGKEFSFAKLKRIGKEISPKQFPLFHCLVFALIIENKEGADR